ncbi:MAG: hypothetical protein IBJ14_05020 [Hydrogenophaga sp.]|nr:hypothetical protein [Hydrogenophaga sp.]
MSDLNVWSNVKVAVQSAIAAPKIIESITKANPAVAEIEAHGYSAGDLLLVKVSGGMRELNYRVLEVLAAPSVDTVSLRGIDSTGFSDFVAGTVERLTLGAECSTLQDFAPSGGEAAGIPVETIHTDDTFEIPGRRTPLVITSTSLWQTADPALVALNGFDARKTPGAVEVTFATGNRMLFAAYASASLAPGGAAGGLVTTPVSLRLRGLITNYPN